MIRKILCVVGVSIILAAGLAVGAQEAASSAAQAQQPTPAQAQPQTPAPAAPVAAASQSDIDCSGFISASGLPVDGHVIDGADNDLRLPHHQWLPGMQVFLRGKIKKASAVGNEYRLVRPARGSLLGGLFGGDLEPIHTFGHTSWYPGQSWSIHTLGEPYEDVGIIKVTSITSKGAVAEVTFACGSVARGDIAIPFEAREIPTYTPGPPPEPFAPIQAKLMGAITAASGNSGVFSPGSRVFINLGESDGVLAGARFRIFNIDWDVVEGWLKAPPDTPPETKGELIVLSTQKKSSVGIVVSATREIYLGDGIVQE